MTNTAPSATHLNQTQIYPAGTASVALDDIVVTDPDGGDAITATLTLANSAAGVLTTSGTAIYIAGVWTITDTVENVNAALALVAFEPDTINAVDTTIATQIRDAALAGPTNGKITLDLNHPPAITSDLGGATASVSFAETTPITTPVTTVTASDPDADPSKTFTLVVGGDSAKFNINPTSGALRFVSAPDFENPTDTDHDNHYEVTVQVSDGKGGIDTQAITVTVTNVAGVTITGTAGDDRLDGGNTIAGQPTPTNEEDIIHGLGGNDMLVGLGGNDTITGDAGNDVVQGGAGADILDGGNGDDTADYSDKSAAGGGRAERRRQCHRDGRRRRRRHDPQYRENIWRGRRRHADRRRQRQFLPGGAGADILDGGDGVDTADYGEKTGAVVGRVERRPRCGRQGRRRRRRHDPQHRERLWRVGGRHVDGRRQRQCFCRPGRRRRTLGRRRRRPLARRRSASDTLDGGAGTDIADYRDKTGSVAVVLTGGATAAVTVGGTAEDTIRNIEEVYGGSAADQLTGDGHANLFIGNGGDDVLKGGGGDDFLEGNAGLDNIDGGTGSDTADYGDRAVPVRVVLHGAASAVVKVGGVNEDTIRNVENVYGGAAADALTGDAGANVLVGRDGSDGLAGGGGNDVLQGGAGRDRLDGGAGSSDSADYTDKSAAVRVRLNGAANAVVFVAGAAEDTVKNIETVVGGSAADTLVGDAKDNAFLGEGGNDVLNGGLGKDFLRGGVGLDRLWGGAGLDVFDFNAVAESPRGAHRDVINDFNQVEQDRIDLRDIDADQRPGRPGNQAFTFIGSDTFAHFHATHPGCSPWSATPAVSFKAMSTQISPPISRSPSRTRT